MNLEERRNKRFQEIVVRLNETGLFGKSGLYDCGALGVAMVFNDGRCMVAKWYELEDPDNIGKEVL